MISNRAGVLIFVLTWISLTEARIPIMQGATDAHSTQIAVLRPKDRPHIYEIWHTPETSEEAFRAGIIHVSSHFREFSNWVVDHVVVTQLTSQTDYQLVVRSLNGGTLLDRRTFQTLNPRRPRAKVVLLSCMLDALHHPALWHHINELRPDLVFFLGDNVYADYIRFMTHEEANEETLWRRYSETRHRLTYSYWPRLIPVLATWDDHDFGTNNGNFNYPFASEAKGVFEAFFPMQENDLLARGPGVASHFQAFGQSFFLMDNRTFRSPPEGENYVGMPAHWGLIQEWWLDEELADLHHPIWFMSGSQYLSDVKNKESMAQDHPASWWRMVQRGRQIEHPFLLVSGDRHYSEINRIEPEIFGFETYEITASAIHATTVRGWAWWNDHRRRVVATDHHNFILAEIHRPHPRTLRGILTAYSYGKQAKFRWPFEITRPLQRTVLPFPHPLDLPIASILEKWRLWSDLRIDPPTLQRSL